MMAHGERRITRRRAALAARFMDRSIEVPPSPVEAVDAPRVTCLEALPERDRLVVLLTFYAEREAPSIAGDLGVKPGAVRAIRHRAIARLRDCVPGEART
jgi:RNA polymerase sigma-70 factor (ECF subfamily)